MELQNMDAPLKDTFLARRYMDDILMFSTKGATAPQRLNECYLPPLKLEDAGNDTFLETSFRITPENRIAFWLKTENLAGKAPKIWRYAHFHSHTAFTQQRAVLTACLKKVHFMASDNKTLKASALQKIHEFYRLHGRPAVHVSCYGRYALL